MTALARARAPLDGRRRSGKAGRRQPTTDRKYGTLWSSTGGVPGSDPRNKQRGIGVITAYEKGLTSARLASCPRLVTFCNWLEKAQSRPSAQSSGLAATRATFENPSEHVILPEIISKEPLGPATRHGDDQWGDIVRWVLNATITAEELGVTQANVGELSKGTDNPDQPHARGRG